jgi:hypothetical protein
MLNFAKFSGSVFFDCFLEQVNPSCWESWHMILYIYIDGRNATTLKIFQDIKKHVIWFPVPKTNIYLYIYVYSF